MKNGKWKDDRSSRQKGVAANKLGSTFDRSGSLRFISAYDIGGRARGSGTNVPAILNSLASLRRALSVHSLWCSALNEPRVRLS